MTLSSNENLESIEKKIEKVNSTKQLFEKKILSKIGDALLNELFTLRSGEETLIIKQPRLIKIKIPSEIRSFIEKINDDALIIETAILYFFYNINELTEELDKKYQENKQIFIDKVNEFCFPNKSDELHRLFKKSDDLIIKFSLPDYIQEKFILLDKKFEEIIVYGILAILKWLNLIQLSQLDLFNKYEQFFLNFIKEFN